MTKASTKKAAPKKAAPKKAAAKKAPAKKAAPKKATTPRKPKPPVKTPPVDTGVYDWTEERKQAAHDQLLIKYNRVEPCRRNTLNVEYMPDGTAKTRGIARQVHSIKM